MNVDTEVQDLRKAQLMSWLNNVVEDKSWQLEVASADASFRRYFRLIFKDKTLIAMDAPPDKEDIKPFIKVASAFKSLGVNVPEIYAQDLNQGFMLLQDFGSVCFLDELADDSADKLYQDAMQALQTLQSSEKPGDVKLPAYDAELLMREMALFSDWFIEKHLSLSISDAERETLNSSFEMLRDNALQQPQVWVHRDYHSRNLMVYEADNPGIIDFQDAVHGAITYDLVSLLRDCYISWPDDKIYTWVASYLNGLKAKGICAEVSNEDFIRWFDLMGAQRHLKAIGIFARLNHRDGKSGYLKDIPRTMSYVETVCDKYPELQSFSNLIENKVKPALMEAQTQ